MLQITIPAGEMYDEIKQEFVETKETTLKLEHSLVSLSKWESKWRKPFLTDDQKTIEETIDYIRCMTLTQNVDPNVYRFITNDNIMAVNDYVQTEQTATWFSKEDENKRNNRIVTSELIYCWMISLQIPFECRKWHLSRLMTLIKVCNEENKPDKKMSGNDIRKRNREINAARRKAMNSKG